MNEKKYYILRKEIKDLEKKYIELFIIVSNLELGNINLPKHILELEKQITEIDKKKNEIHNLVMGKISRQKKENIGRVTNINQMGI